MDEISKSTYRSIPVSLISKIKSRDFFAVRGFLEAYNSKILKIANRFARRGSFDHDLLVQIGSEAAYNAICTCQLSKGNIEPYVCRAIRNGVYEECRKVKRLHKLVCPLSFFKNEQVSPEKNFEIETQNDGFDNVDRQDAWPVMQRKIHLWLEGLSEQKRKLIGLVFFGNMNQSQAAKEMGLTRARVSQLYSEILEDGRITLASIAHLN